MLKRIFQTTSERRTYQFYFLVGFALVRTFLELAMLASLLLFIGSLSNPATIMENSTVLFFNRLLSLGLNGENYSRLIIISAILLSTLTILKNLAVLVGEYIVTHFSLALAGEFGHKLMVAMLNADYEWILSKNRTDLIQNIEWRWDLAEYLHLRVSVIEGFVLCAVLVLTLFIVNPLPSLIAFLFLGSISFILFGVIKQKVDRVAEQQADTRKSMLNTVRNSINGIKDVFISRSALHFLEQFQTKLILFARKEAKLRFTARVPVSALEMFGFVLLGLGVWALVSLSSFTSERILNIVYLFSIAAWRLLPLVSRILSDIAKLRTHRPVVHSMIDLLEELLRYPHASLHRLGEQRVHHVTEFSLENGFYRYRSRKEPALQGIHFSIARGEKLGVIGSSGAGKSTLVDIIVGLLPLEKGKLLINKINAQQIVHQDWANQIGYVSQSPFFFEGTIAENIVFGQNPRDIDYEKLQRVSKQAAMDFLEELPDGLDSVLGERGVQLSGGQIQRVAIARALYRDPSIIIFDEATSALDTNIERSIMDTIYNIGDEIMVIIIAHRLTTVERCTKILWLEEGKLKQFGDPKEVIQVFNARVQ